MGKISHFFQYSILGLIIAIAGVLLFYAAATDSAIFDESAHIPAGYSYVRYLDYRLNPEHPPLLKALAAFPLLFMNLNFPTASTMTAEMPMARSTSNKVNPALSRAMSNVEFLISKNLVISN